MRAEIPTPQRAKARSCPYKYRPCPALTPFCRSLNSKSVALASKQQSHFAGVTRTTSGFYQSYFPKVARFVTGCDAANRWLSSHSLALAALPHPHTRRPFSFHTPAAALYLFQSRISTWVTNTPGQSANAANQPLRCLLSRNERAVTSRFQTLKQATLHTHPKQPSNFLNRPSTSEVDMADLSTTHDNGSPGADDLENGNGAIESRGVKRPRTSTAADDDDDDDDKPGRERRKIEIKFIQDKSRRHITFSKRKAGIMKKVSLRPRNKNATRSYRVSIMPQLLTLRLGIRTVSPYWHTSPPSRRLRDWPGVHLHHTQAPATRDQARRQESDSSRSTFTPDYVQTTDT